MSWMVVDAQTGAIKQRGLASEPTPASGEQVYRESAISGAEWVAAERAWSIETEASLITKVKVEAERRKMLVRSPGSGKGAEYRMKRDEAAASANIAAAVLNALTKANALVQYPNAAMEAELRGESIAAVLTRYRAAVAAADSEVARLAAIEQAGVARIKSAPTGAAKRAAFAGINWSWKP